MAKGSDFERNAVKALSWWWSYGERDDIFYRTAGSGARHTARMKKSISTYNSAGDVGYLDPEGKVLIDYFLIELKRGYTSMGRITRKAIQTELERIEKKNLDPAEALQKFISRKLKKGGDVIDVLDFIDANKECVLTKWWDKAEKEKEKSGRKEILIILKRDMKNECIMTTYNVIDTFANIDDFRLIQFEPAGYQEQYIIVLLEDFLEKIDPNTIKRSI